MQRDPASSCRVAPAVSSGQQQGLQLQLELYGLPVLPVVYFSASLPGFNYPSQPGPDGTRQRPRCLPVSGFRHL